MEKILHFLIDNWQTNLMIGATLLELILRFVPSEKNRSIITLIFKIIDAILPNLKKGGGTFKAVVLFMLLSAGAYAQTNTVTKGLASINVDSAVFKQVISNLQGTYGDVGGLYYNRESGKWRIFYDSAWHDLIQAGGGGGVPADPLNSIQFNSGGVFGGSGLLTYDSTNAAITLDSSRISAHGTNNVFWGSNAGNFTNTANNNVGIGKNALKNLTVGYRNIALGEYSLENNTNGLYNIAIGSNTLRSNVSGALNIAIGYNAGKNIRNNSSLSTSNIAIGENSMSKVGGSQGAGIKNIAIGTNTLGLSQGDRNISIGYHSSAETQTSGSNNIVIGTDQEVPDTTASNQINIGGLIYAKNNTGGLGLLGLSQNIPTAKLHIKGNSNVYPDKLFYGVSSSNQDRAIIYNDGSQENFGTYFYWKLNNASNYLQGNTNYWEYVAQSTGDNTNNLRVTKIEANTNTVKKTLYLEGATSSTATNNIGVAFDMVVEDDAGSAGILTIGHILNDVSTLSKNSTFYIDGYENSSTTQTRFFEIRSVSSGQLWYIMKNLPTVSPCGTAPSGTLWNNANVINVCP